eukprot:6556575-Pyramimonas_sp.AAC.1
MDPHGRADQHGRPTWQTNKANQHGKPAQQTDTADQHCRAARQTSTANQAGTARSQRAQDAPEEPKEYTRKAHPSRGSRDLGEQELGRT